MAKKVIQAQMQQRRDTAANWAASNPVLLDGEMGIVTDDPNLYKVGDGVTAWNDLKFRGFDGTLVQTTGDSENAVMSQKAVTAKLTELESKASQYDSALLELDINPNAGWEMGSYNASNGAILESTTTIHTRVLYTGTKPCYINFGGTYRYALHQYNEKGQFVAVLNTFNMSASVISIEANTYFRLFLRKMDQSEITDSSFVNNIIFYYPKEEVIDLREKAIISVDAIASSLSNSLLTKVGQRFYNITSHEIRELVTLESTKLVEFNQHESSMLLCNDILYLFDENKNPYPIKRVVEIIDMVTATSLSSAGIGDLYYNIAEKSLRKIVKESAQYGKTSIIVPLFEHLVYRCEDKLYIYNGIELEQMYKEASIDKPIQPLVHYQGNIGDFIQGSFGTDGNLYPTNTYTCHTGMLRFADNAIIKVNENINSFVIYFNDSGTWIPAISKVIFQSQSKIVIRKNINAMVFFRYADNRIMTSDVMSALKQKIEVNLYPLLVSEVSRMSYWVAPKIPSIVDKIGNISYNEMINKYQQLVAAHSDYLSMSDVVLDSSGNFMIKEIVAAPSAYDKTIMIVTGMHGNEYESIWSMYYFLELLCKNYLEWPELTDIRNNVRLVMIPIASPYSFENNQRENVNGLDPNWNYDVFWGIEGREWNGTAPFSEKEALAVKMVFDKYQHEINFVYDWHTDPYDGLGNYITIEHAVPDYEESVKRIREEKDRLNYISHGSRNAFINNNQRSSSYNYFSVKRGVPSAIVEFSNNQISAEQGDSAEMTWALQWFVNVLVEQIKRLPYKVEYGYEGYVKSSDKELYEYALINDICAKDLVCAIPYKDASIKNEVSNFTLFIKGSFSKGQDILKLGDAAIKTEAIDANSYRLHIGNLNVTNPLFKFNRNAILEIRQIGGNLSVYADCHLVYTFYNANMRFSSIQKITEMPILLYDKALSNKDMYATYRGLTKL